MVDIFLYPVEGTDIVLSDGLQPSPYDGHVSGHAELPATVARGVGRVWNLPVIARPRVFQRIHGEGKTSHRRPRSSGQGSFEFPSVAGVGSAALPLGLAHGRGRFDLRVGVGSAVVPAPDAAGIGTLAMPEPIRTSTRVEWEPDYPIETVSAALRAPRRAFRVTIDDEDDEDVLMLMETLR